MYLQSSQSLNLISRQTVRLGAKPLVLVCAKELARLGVLAVLPLAEALAEVRVTWLVALDVGMFAMRTARLVAIALATELALLLARRTVTTLAIIAVVVDALVFAKELALELII